MDDLQRLLDYVLQTEQQHFIETHAPNDASKEEIAIYEQQPYRIDPNATHIYTLAMKVKKSHETKAN